jgi:hypothetical protein
MTIETSITLDVISTFPEKQVVVQLTPANNADFADQFTESSCLREINAISGNKSKEIQLTCYRIFQLYHHSKTT